MSFLYFCLAITFKWISFACTPAHMVGHPALPLLHFSFLFSRRRLSLFLLRWFFEVPFFARLLWQFHFMNFSVRIFTHCLHCMSPNKFFLALSSTLPIPSTLVADCERVVGRKQSGLRTGSYCSHKFIQTIRSYNILLHELINCFFPGLLIFHIAVIYFRSNKIYDRRHLACSSSLHRTRIRWCVVSP